MDVERTVQRCVGQPIVDASHPRNIVRGGERLAHGLGDLSTNTEFLDGTRPGSLRGSDHDRGGERVVRAGGHHVECLFSSHPAHVDTVDADPRQDEVEVSSIVGKGHGRGPGDE